MCSLSLLFLSVCVCVLRSVWVSSPNQHTSSGIEHNVLLELISRNVGSYVKFPDTYINNSVDVFCLTFFFSIFFFFPHRVVKTTATGVWRTNIAGECPEGKLVRALWNPHLWTHIPVFRFKLLSAWLRLHVPSRPAPSRPPLGPVSSHYNWERFLWATLWASAFHD